MPVAGVGGLIGQVMFPDLDNRLAQHITPNPNPLAQQGGPAVPGSVDSLGNKSPSAPPPGSNLAPAASTQGDPIVSSYARDMIAATRRDAMAQGVNSGLDTIASGFGTAQQQASKQAALHGGGVGSSLSDLAGIQKMQDQTIADNEHARFMGNAHIFGETLRAQGVNVTDEQATEIMNGGRGMSEQFTGAAAGNATLTGTSKDAETAAREYAKANPEATPQQIADYKANLIAGGMGGADLTDRQYLSYAASERAAGRTPDDLLTWKAKHATEAKEQDATAINIANAKKALPGVNTSVANMTRIADGLLGQEETIKGIFADKNKVRWANDIMKGDPKSNVALWAIQSGGLTKEEAQVVLDAMQLHNMNYRGAFAGEGGVKGIRSQVEADRVSRAADQLGVFTDAKSYLKNIRILKGTYGSAQANAAGEAQAYDQIPENVRHKLDPSYYEGGANAPKDLPEWAKVKTVNSKADWEALPNGQAYRAPSSEHGSKILIKGYEQTAMDDEDNG